MKNIIITAALVAAFAGAATAAEEEATVAASPITIAGTYEGTITDSGTYSDTLEVVVVGTAPEGSVTIELDKTGTVGDLYLDTKILMFDVQLGTVDSVNGIRVGTTVAGITVSAHQISGTNQRTTLDAGYTLGPINVSGVDVLDSARLMSADLNVGGVDLGGSYQNTTVGANTIADAGLEVAGFQVEGAFGDINDASVTKIGAKKHALLGVMTTATNGTKVYGGKVTLGSNALGSISGKVVRLNSNNTYTAALSRNLMTYSYEKVSGGASTVSAGVVFKF